jgi:putative two-component system response regulator
MSDATLAAGSGRAKPLILVVDDAPQNLSLMDDLLSDNFQVKVAPNGIRALKIAHGSPQPDLILLDIMMPDMDGYEVCQRLKADPVTRDIPVIFLTAKSESADESKGFEMGAVDYVTKPISPAIVLARINTHLSLKDAATFLKDKTVYLELEVERRMLETRMTEEVTILAMTSLAETRDNETGHHILRTQRYVRALAVALRDHPRFSGYLNDKTIDLLFRSAPLHDIGKVGIPDRILLKPGKLTPEEFEVMKTHTTLGFNALERAKASTGFSVAFLDVASEIALSHQEKWDGSGYPQGLAGDDIPVSARLMAVADVYDALISRRVYKAAFSHERAMSIIAQSRAAHFDPDVVDAFFRIQDEVQGIATEFADSDEEIEDLALRQQQAA